MAEKIKKETYEKPELKKEGDLKDVTAGRKAAMKKGSRP